LFAGIDRNPAKSSERKRMSRSPRISPARVAAFDVLLRVETRASYAVELLHSNLLDGLTPADRALATEIVMGVLRWQQNIDSELQSAIGKTLSKFDIEVLLSLRIGLYQLRSLDRIPASAAVNESVELVKAHRKRSAAPLVNAILRKLSKSPPPAQTVPLSVEALSRRFAHPLWMVQRWADAYSIEIAATICEYDQQRPHTTIRVTSPDIRQEIEAEGIQLEASEIVSDAWRVAAGDVTTTAAYRARRLAIQDESSQLVALLASGNSILDCCAAPGGKSAVAAERNASALIVSMDRHVHRVKLMRELIRPRNLLAADALQLPFLENFDCIIADMPCAGTGTLARNPEIKWRLQIEDLARLGSLQSEILESISMHVKPGGAIVYSTCSLEPEEGEDVIAGFLSRHSQFRIVPIVDRLRQLDEQGAIRAGALALRRDTEFLRTFPGVQQGDGFFAALLQRTI
jgi:16S rRNA (cytosine967-C5)-methyltransferase